ncbi:MAG: hypothetical protein JXB14_01230 [Candidatus Altiarchaeota archaeon]|nr:hypothetical protein [Candidatus Altiarchaeota archaeon]
MDEWGAITLGADIVLFLAGAIVENKFKINNWIKRKYAYYSGEEFIFTLENEIDADKSDLEKVKNALFGVFKLRGYTISVDANYKTKVIFSAKNDRMEEFKVQLTFADKPVINLDSVETTLKKANRRFNEWGAILNELNNEKSIKTTLSSFSAVLPFPLVDVRPPKGMKLAKYEIIFVDKNKVRITVSSRGVNVSSGNRDDLRTCFENLLK